MLTKIRSLALNCGIVAAIALILALSMFFSHKQNSCTEEVMELFISRSNLEYNALVDLSDRNVLFSDRNMQFILNDTYNAKHNENLGMQELGKSQEFAKNIEEITRNISNKKSDCDDLSWINQILIAITLILVIFQLLIALKIIKQTKW